VFNRPKSIEEIREIDPEALSILEFECQKDKDGSPVVLFKLPRRHDSAVEMARIMGLHKDKVELTGKDGGPVELTTTERAAKIASILSAAMKRKE
jgi:hypothetical protein